MNILNLFRRSKENPQKDPSRTDRFEIILSGSGGQGIVLAGRILAEAAALYDNKEAIMAQSYGPEARGGASRAEIVISPVKIGYPKVMDADVLLAMTQEAMDKYGELLSPRGLLIVDDTFVKKVPSRIKHVFKVPFSSIAIKLLEGQIVANIIALGALASITKAVSREALIKEVLARVSEKVLVKDRVAVDAGFKTVADSGFRWSK